MWISTGEYVYHVIYDEWDRYSEDYVRLPARYRYSSTWNNIWKQIIIQDVSVVIAKKWEWEGWHYMVTTNVQMKLAAATTYTIVSGKQSVYSFVRSAGMHLTKKNKKDRQPASSLPLTLAWPELLQRSHLRLSTINSPLPSNVLGFRVEGLGNCSISASLQAGNYNAIFFSPMMFRNRARTQKHLRGSHERP